MNWKDIDWSPEGVVRFALRETANGCEITLTHRGWQSTLDDICVKLMSAYREGRAFRLANLARFAENDAAGGAPNATDG